MGSYSRHMVRATGWFAAIAAAMEPGCSVGERGVERDRGAGERLAHRAADLRRLGRADEVVLAQPRHPAPHRDVATGDALTRLERDVGPGVKAIRWGARLGQSMRERHRVAGGVRGGD